jgi:hypothetical protein
MLNVLQFRTNIVRPVLTALGAHSMAAENLVIGTAVQESNLHYLRQLNEGPARGLYQMEPATHDDHWQNYLAYRAELRGRVEAFSVPNQDRHGQLAWNLAYATAMCRIHYLRAPAPLPNATDIAGLAQYWKQYYNTSQGKGTVAEFADKFERFVVLSGDIPEAKV